MHSPKVPETGPVWNSPRLTMGLQGPSFEKCAEEPKAEKKHFEGVLQYEKQPEENDVCCCLGMGQNYTTRIWTAGFTPGFHLPGQPIAGVGVQFLGQEPCHFLRSNYVSPVITTIQGSNSALHPDLCVPRKLRLVAFGALSGAFRFGRKWEATGSHGKPRKAMVSLFFWFNGRSFDDFSHERCSNRPHVWAGNLLVPIVRIPQIVVAYPAYVGWHVWKHPACMIKTSVISWVKRSFCEGRELGLVFFPAWHPFHLFQGKPTRIQPTGKQHLLPLRYGELTDSGVK